MADRLAAVVTDERELRDALAGKTPFEVRGDEAFLDLAVRLAAEQTPSRDLPTSAGDLSVVQGVKSVNLLNLERRRPLLNGYPFGWTIIGLVVVPVAMWIGARSFENRSPASGDVPSPPLSTTLPPAATHPSALDAYRPDYAWPAVAVIAILCLTFLITRAVRADRDVTLTWKVTSYAAGSLVLRKIPVRAGRKPKKPT